MKMKLSDITEKIPVLLQEFRNLTPKAKLMAVGTVLLLLLSIVLACGNVIDRMVGEGSLKLAGVTSEEEGLVTADMDPIPLATPKTQLATSLMELLANDECVWIAEDDPLCAMDFNEEGFTEYNGDIETACTVQFYEIAALDNGRAGVWRVVYPDGTAKDARFTFTEDLETGEYIIESWAFPSCGSYRAKAISGTSMLE